MIFMLGTQEDKYIKFAVESVLSWKKEMVWDMKANKKTLLAVKSFLENEQEYWDKEEMISDIVGETKLLVHNNMGNVSPDECDIRWDNDTICNLDDFISAFSDRFLEKICNILESFIGDDISCYFDEDY